MVFISRHLKINPIQERLNDPKSFIKIIKKIYYQPEIKKLSKIGTLMKLNRCRDQIILMFKKSVSNQPSTEEAELYIHIGVCFYPYKLPLCVSTRDTLISRSN